MTAPIAGFPTTIAPGGSTQNVAEKKKRVLLVDTCRAKRYL
jgi:hypothetical protein